MRFLAGCILCLVTLCAAGTASARTAGIPSFDQSLARISFESVDLSPLRPWAHQRVPELPDDELDQRISANIRFICHNLLNRRHFVVAPDPGEVVAQVVQILELLDRLNGLLEDGRSMELRKPETRQDFVKEVGTVAKRLHDLFTAYFTEGYGSAYRFNLRVSSDPVAQLRNFIAESEAIVGQLTDRTEKFFLNAAPGAVSLEQYRSSSIGVLLRSLRRLADIVARRLEANGIR